MRVLVIEDQPAFLTALSDALRKRDHDVTSCTDAESAWAAWQHGAFPLVLLDLHLPGEDGISFCKRLRADEYGASSVIVVVTGTVDTSDLIEVGKLADDYIPKPISWEQVDIRLMFAERRATSVIERWRDQNERKNSDTRFTAFMNHSPATAWLKDADGCFVYANKAFERAYGLRNEDIVGKCDDDLWPGAAQEFRANDVLVLTSGKSIETIETVPNPDGTHRYWLVNKFPINDASGDRFVGGIALDITDRHTVDRMLATERELLQTIMDHVPDFLYVKDRESKFVRANRATARFLGIRQPQDVIGRTDHDFFPKSLADQYFADEQRVMEHGIPVLNRLEAQNAEHTLWSLTSTVPIRDAEGEITGIVGVSRDVTDRRRMEEEIRRSDERQRALLAAIPDLIFRFNRDGVHLDVNADQYDSLGRPAHELVGQPLSELLPPEPEARVMQTIQRALETGELQVVEIDADVAGEWRKFEARIVTCGQDEVLAIARDVTEQRTLAAQLEFQATHDPLTGLPNRSLLSNRLQQALSQSKRQGMRVALLFVDLDDFKTINDELGHAIGDRLLVEIGEKLRNCVRESDTVARLGGDEFAILMPDVRDASAPETLAKRIHDQLSVPIDIDGHELSSQASIGISISRNGRVEPSELLRRADVAMYEAKRSGKARHSVFKRPERVA